ncbi:MAG TPA: histidine phosphatase family protein [Steroidobacteraceae bacterium]|nr:histidine phosphatase family protein [Steroidobacteraceae bacterium]
MLRLTLIRHAKTSPAHDGQEDWDRELEAKGKHEAQMMSERVKDQDLIPDLIITSPAVRARSTTKIFAEHLKVRKNHIVEDERLYLASPDVMLTVLKELSGTHHHVFMVGHNPGITEFADRLSKERSVDNMPTSAVFTLEFHVKNWADVEWRSGVNAEFDYPRR